MTLYALNRNFWSTFNHFADIAGFLSQQSLFPYPTPIPAEIWGVPFGDDP